MQRNCFGLIVCILFLSCQQSVTKEQQFITNQVEVPDFVVDQAELYFNNNNTTWTLDDQIFSGYAVSYYQDKTLKHKFGILNGKKHGESTRWYSDGGLKQSSFYQYGKLHGAKKAWSNDESHILISHLNYTTGKLDGVQKKWYPSGEIFKVLQLKMGEEDGMQKAYRKNGQLFANYEAKDGRIYGLKRASLCYGLKDEEVQ
jgi:antitoxin component YwqK of YwqJK toxin-antitoxin module